MSASVFDPLPLTPTGHARVNLHAAVAHLLGAIERLGDTGELALPAVLERHPFLRDHLAAVASELPDDLAWPDAPAWWQGELTAWEADAPGPLPLVALTRMGVDLPARMALLAAGLVEEDPRIGAVLAELQRPLAHRRPTLATLALLAGPGTDPWSLRSDLVRTGLLDGGEDLPDVDAPVRVPAALWTVLRGSAPDAGLLDWAQYHPVEELIGLDDLLLSDTVRSAAWRAVRAGLPAVVVTGSAASGRRRLLGAVARAHHLGALFVDEAVLDTGRRRLLAPLCVALGAMPVVRVTSGATTGGATATAEVARPRGYDGPLGVVAGVEVALTGTAVGAAARIELPRLGPDQRRRHWEAVLGDHAGDDLQVLAERFLLPEGHVRRLAGQAVLTARLDGRAEVTIADVAAATRTLGHQRLGGLARRLDPLPGWHRLVVDDATQALLAAVQARCRHRERLADHLGVAVAGDGSIGVRVLLSGPSGTGKTLAARILAAELHTEVYRVDLAAVVDKYIGETEKNLDRVLSAAEELDVLLLIDEGDALLGTRTEVRSANDRFANLETNYLLQRLEGYQGVVLITTNAEDRIDAAFQRRMDAVVHFQEPEPEQRRAIWRVHLPADHAVPPAVLEELARRAQLTGGQIRNAVLQAALAAVDAGEVISADHLERAVAAEYRKAGAVSPFQRPAAARGSRRAEAFLDALP